MKTLEELKESGEAPEWLNSEGFFTLHNGYLLPNETPKGMYKRVSSTVASKLKRPDLESKFFDLLFKNWLGLSSPVASNVGTANLPISCFSSSVQDSTSDIFMHYHELALMAKYGGGTGSYWGNVRGRGAKISKGGVSQGIVPWLKALETSVQAVAQAGVRRGSVATYLDIDHADIEDFIDIRSAGGDPSRKCLSTNFHHGVCISDDFMNSIVEGDKKNRSTWATLNKKRVEWGEPYIMWKDTANKKAPQMYKDLGLKIETSNLCLSGETLVTTLEFGPTKIEELVGKQVTIFDGENWVLNKNFTETSESNFLYRINFDNGSFVDCTQDHKWPVFDIDSYWMVKTKDLLIGSEVQAFVINSNNNTEIYLNVLKIEKLPGEHKTYCTNVPTTHKFLLSNGLMTGNCNEIYLHTDKDHSFVCCLSSMNLARYDEWKDTDAVYLATYFLDGVMEDFIEKASNIPGFEKSVRFAIKSRALGLGVIGWHTLLQSKLLPFDSFQSMQLNAEIFRHIDVESLRASQNMAKEYGEPEWCKGYGVRNTHRIAIAPTTTNSILAGGVSQGIEPIGANIFNQKTAKGVFIRKNPLLLRLLEEKEQNTLEIWNLINQDKGSVRNLKFLSPEEKEVFLTAREINQFAIVRQAGQRQKWIDQGQSVNLLFAMPNNITDEKEKKALSKYINDVHLEAWRLGLKGLYYVRTESVLKGEPVFKTESDCQSCEG